MLAHCCHLCSFGIVVKWLCIASFFWNLIVAFQDIINFPVTGGPMPLPSLHGNCCGQGRQCSCCHQSCINVLLLSTACTVVGGIAAGPWCCCWCCHHRFHLALCRLIVALILFLIFVFCYWRCHFQMHAWSCCCLVVPLVGSATAW